MKNIRIWELAAELELTNAEVLALCDVMRIGATTASSALTEAQADRVGRRHEEARANRASYLRGEAICIEPDLFDVDLEWESLRPFAKKLRVDPYRANLLLEWQAGKLDLDMARKIAARLDHPGQQTRGVTKAWFAKQPRSIPRRRVHIAQARKMQAALKECPRCHLRRIDRVEIGRRGACAKCDPDGMRPPRRSGTGDFVRVTVPPGRVRLRG